MHYGWLIGVGAVSVFAIGGMAYANHKSEMEREAEKKKQDEEIASQKAINTQLAVDNAKYVEAIKRGLVSPQAAGGALGVTDPNADKKAPMAMLLRNFNFPS